ncbi:exodeoxyribonuclease VII large subunit [Desulfonema limicola]|uniref:exodeoxyribonuclease VII large subunit n=1 Tax=Desulfonema limicola TaxID=45656 RepID=UPI001FE772B6|nr:exodeoxyribonuclease VII large subunit [Desulfonema limicola]
MKEPQIQKQIFTVSALTAEIKALLEDRFSFVWITGEISNFHVPASGHFYFTLKDQKAQINAVMFKGQNKNLKFMPEHGMSITGLGRIGLYEPRGSYQIIFEYLEPKGVGELQIAFEQLKARLASEGLFDEKHKKPIPFLPEKISVVTSRTGAVIHDIIKVINRRFPGVHIELAPVKVQGDGADQEIADAIKLLNERMDSDLIILARGGGSLEDFQAFNSEITAYAIFESKIPVISGVGHETDITIADFVSDLRAPTPSAAAELAVPLKQELVQKNLSLLNNLSSRFYYYIEQKRKSLQYISSRLVHPKKRVQDLRLRIDDFSERLFRLMLKSVLLRRREQYLWLNDKFRSNNPLNQVKDKRQELELKTNNLKQNFMKIFDKKSAEISELTSKLSVLNPAAILSRGYSIARTMPEGRILHDTSSIILGQKIDLRLSKGILLCRVEGILENGSKTDL